MLLVSNSKLKKTNFNNITEENTIRQNQILSCIPDHPWRILIIGHSVSEIAGVLLELNNNEPDIDKR